MKIQKYINEIMPQIIGTTIGFHYNQKLLLIGYELGHAFADALFKNIPAKHPLPGKEKIIYSNDKSKKEETHDNSEVGKINPELKVIYFNHLRDYDLEKALQKKGIPFKIKYNQNWEIMGPMLSKPYEPKYKQTLGVKLLAYLAYYCKTIEDMIRADLFRSLANDWHGKHSEDHVKDRSTLSKSPMGNDANNIKSAIYTAFGQKDNKLKFLTKDYSIEKVTSPGNEDIEFFYYKPISGYIIEVNDEEIKKFPPPTKT